MAENLNVGTRINSGLWEPVQTNNSTIEKYCYDNTESNCDIYGGLYQWNEMIQYAPFDDETIGTTQGICPNGWHLPSDAEWKELEMYLGMNRTEADTTGWLGTDEGGKLKEAGTTHWPPPNTGATNESGFSALPGGLRFNAGGVFINLGSNGYFWSATEYDNSTTWSRSLSDYDAHVYRENRDKEFGQSVRCLKD